jgi:uncharacterized flavoprotein (TIGR03862 family)
MRHRWLGWQGHHLVFGRRDGAPPLQVKAEATVLALGGASWPHLGSDGTWQVHLQQEGVEVAPFKPANCGFDVLGREGQGWTAHFRAKFAGHPLKSVVLTVPAADAQGAALQSPRFERKGEFVITETGLEGSLVYAASARLRDDLAERGQAHLLLDLLPDKTPEQVFKEVAWPRGSRSLSSHLKSRLGLDGAKMGLLFELCSPQALAQPDALAALIKALPVPLKSARPVAEAISTAGGVALQAMGPDLMLAARPGVFCAGEMLDWEAPTGGYLLTACLASGHRAAQGVLRGLAGTPHTF